MGDGEAVRGSLGLRVLAVMLVSVALVALVVVPVGLRELLEAMRRLSWRPLVFVFAVEVALALVRTQRARCLLPRPVRWWDALVSVSVGFMASVSLPLRLGGVVRPILLQRRAAVPFGEGLAGGVAERVLDVMALAVLVAVVAAAPGALPVDAAVGPWLPWISVLALVGAVGLGGMAWGGEALTRRVAPSLGRLGRVGVFAARVLAEAARAFAHLRAKPRALIEGALWTALMWVSALVLPWAILSPLGVPADPLSLAFVWATVMLAVAAIPTPGSVGAFEAAGALALGLLGVDAADAAAAVVLLHGGTLGSNLIIGLCFLPAALRDRAGGGVASRGSMH